MANPEHLQILQQGVTVWNAWREQNGDIRPDLYHADLRGVNLRGINLISANLSRARLSGADLSPASLREADLNKVRIPRYYRDESIIVGSMLYGSFLDEANLRDADLSHANLCNAFLNNSDLSGACFSNADLRGVNLGEANLREADLRGANLSMADLNWASFVNADLTGADVSEADLISTVFGDTNLTAVQGLETCYHLGPSILDHRTLTKSGLLPLAFLRGCGLPVALINYLPSLLNEPFQFYSCFISYASKDHAFAERLHADLQNKGVRCWFAPEDLKIGDRNRPRIDEMIRLYDKLLLILSKTSVMSQWVEQEVETALARERQQGTTILFPVRIDNMVMTLETGWLALIRNTRHIGDFRRWKTHDVYQKVFDRLLRDLTSPDKKPRG
jgi:TIR domain/Pentapeptide repeats (8 copies)